MKIRNWGLISALVLLFSLFISMNVLASYPSVSKSKPLKAYGWQTKDYKVFSDSDLTEKIETISYGECTVIAIKDDAAKILYNKGKSTGWIDIGRLVYNPEYNQQVAYANSALTLYQRPTVTSEYVSISQYSGGVVVGERGSWVQLIFKYGTGYYMGWMKMTTYESRVRLSMETTTQPLANGTYILIPRSASARALTYHSGSGTFSVTANKKAKTQKFTLQYVKNGDYIISPANAEGDMVDEGGLTIDENEGQTWKLTRSGGYFYIRSVATSRSLRYTSGKVSATAFRKVKAQQWRLVKAAETASVENSVVFSQYDPKWGGSTYYNGATRKTISTSGCGVMALTNAIYALNGEFISPTKIASFSASRGHYFYDQGTADTLYADFASVYGNTYHFKHVGKTYSLSTVQKYLKKGCVAIALVPGHYIAITGYRSSDGAYLVLDSAVYGKRPTTIYGDWLSASTLGSGTMNCEYFHIFAKQ